MSTPHRPYENIPSAHTPTNQYPSQSADFLTLQVGGIGSSSGGGHGGGGRGGYGRGWARGRGSPRANWRLPDRANQDQVGQLRRSTGSLDPNASSDDANRRHSDIGGSNSTGAGGFYEDRSFFHSQHQHQQQDRRQQYARQPYQYNPQRDQQQFRLPLERSPRRGGGGGGNQHHYSHPRRWSGANSGGGRDNGAKHHSRYGADDMGSRRSRMGHFEPHNSEAGGEKFNFRDYFHSSMLEDPWMSLMERQAALNRSKIDTEEKSDEEDAVKADATLGCDEMDMDDGKAENENESKEQDIAMRREKESKGEEAVLAKEEEKSNNEQEDAVIQEKKAKKRTSNEEM